MANEKLEKLFISILDKSITTDSLLVAKTSLIYVENCFSEYASS